MVPLVHLLAVSLSLLTFSHATDLTEHHVIYVRGEKGTMDSSCWTGGRETPCASLDFALRGAELMRPSIVSVKQDNCECYNQECPTWFYPTRNQSNPCKCGDPLSDVVRCNETLKEVAVIGCYCITYDSMRNRTVAGACFYNCESATTRQDKYYHRLPSDISKLNDVMCGHLNREGQLCGKCKNGFFPPVYSYNTECVNCNGTLHSRAMYAAVVTLPLTVFFVLVCVFRISAASPQLNAFIFVSHVLGTSTSTRIITAALHKHGMAAAAVHILATVYGFWNLDFFRTLLPPICLEITTLQSLALDYITAFYPLSLCVITYLLSAMYRHNFRLIVWLCRPFDRCFSRLRRQWDVRTSSIDALATFLLLAYAKILNVSADLLIPTEVFDVHGKRVGFYLYYDASIEYFGKKHLPYAILALTMVVFFILLPLALLVLYPTRLFQKYQLQSGVLYTFLNAFQGSYMDGTDSTRDTRYFAAVYLLARIVIVVAYAVTLTTFYYALGLILLIVLALIVIVVKPYRNTIYNRVDTVLILLLAMVYSSILSYNIASVKESRHVKVTLSMSFIVAALPLVYLFLICIYWVLTRSLVQDRLLYGTRIGRWIKTRSTSYSEIDIPYRLLSPEDCDSDVALLGDVMVDGDSASDTTTDGE